MTPLGSPLRDARSAALVVGVVAMAVFANAVANRFAYDDVHIVVANPAIQDLETLPGALLKPYWPGEYGRELGLWRPMTTALLGLEYVASGGAPWLFHVTNVAGHALCAVLVLLLLVELMPLAAAFAAGLLFAVHPVHVEAVANVIGVSEILSTAALLCACLVHVRSPTRSGWRIAVLIAVLYAIGFGAKESAVTLPGVIFLLDAARRPIGFGDVRGYVRDRWRVYVAMTAVAGVLLWARFAILGSIASPFGPLGADLLAEVPRIWTLADVWTHYVRLWVFPLDLSADYSPNVIPVSVSWHATNSVGLAVTLLLLGVALLAWRRADMSPATNTARTAAFGVVWFIITLSPISNALFLSGVLLAERTLYLPSVGLAAATGWLVVRMSKERPRGACVALVVVLALASVRTWTRTPTWRDNETMLTKLVSDYPQSGRSQWILGDAFVDVGAVSEGLRSYRLAIDILGPHYQLLTEIAKKLLKIEHTQAAERLLQFASQNNPEFPLAFSLLATVRAEHGDAPATVTYGQRSLSILEPDPISHHLVAWGLAAQGRWNEAAESRRRADELARVTFWQQWMYLAYARRHEGDSVGAYAAVDSAWTHVVSEIARHALDSVRVAEFGLPSLLDAPPAAADTINR